MMKTVRDIQSNLNDTVPLIAYYYPVTRSVLDILLCTLAAYEGALEEGKTNFRIFFEW